MTRSFMSYPVDGMENAPMQSEPMTYFAILTLEPRPTGEPPRCRHCGVVCNHALSPGGNVKVIDPICRRCTGQWVGYDKGILRRRPLSILEWAGGVTWGRKLWTREVVPLVPVRDDRAA